MPTPKKPGIYRNVERNEYHLWDAANVSHLKQYARSAAHARQAELQPRVPTSALDFGDALHARLFEPERFHGEYAVAPKVDKRRKADREVWDTFAAAHPGVILLREQEEGQLEGMVEGVMRHPVARELLAAPGVRELSAYWIDPEFKVPCKARLDLFTRLAGHPVVVDLKSTKDASPRGFPREVAKYGWHLQAAFYLEGLRILSPVERRFLFIAAEKEPPYCAAVYDLDLGSIEVGRREVRRYLEAWTQARTTQTWPGYPPGLTTVTLPKWVFYQEDDDAQATGDSPF